MGSPLRTKAMEGLAGISRETDKGQFQKCDMEGVCIECSDGWYNQALYAVHPVAYSMSDEDGIVFPGRCRDLANVRV